MCRLKRCKSAPRLLTVADNNHRLSLELRIWLAITAINIERLTALRKSYCRLVMAASPRPSTVRAQLSAEEWQARIDLAAAYRLVALYGWDDLIVTHISARVPGGEHHFRLNTYGILFDEVTASRLVKVDP